MRTIVKIVVLPIAIIIFADQWLPADSLAITPLGSNTGGVHDPNVRDKRIAPGSPGAMDLASRVRIKKAHHSVDHDPQLRALGEFLKQTRQLGVPDVEALALLDKELANARLPSLKASLGNALPSQPTTPVYHATPLRPFGALHVPNTKPYEKQRPVSTPIKEDQHDVPAPKRPLVVESARLPKPQPSLSPQHLVALQSPGKVTEAIPIKTKPFYVPTKPVVSLPIREIKPSVQLFQQNDFKPAEPVVTYPSVPKLVPTPVYPVKSLKPVASLHESLPKEADSDGYASRYQFGYRIRDPHSGSDFGHSEARQGEHTEGGYHVLLPDGRIQNVRYWAGPSGFHASVSYTGDANHPHHH